MVIKKIEIDAKAAKAIKEYIRKKRMRQQLLAMNDVVYRSGTITDAEYQDTRRKLGGTD